MELGSARRANTACEIMIDSQALLEQCFTTLLTPIDPLGRTADSEEKYHHKFRCRTNHTFDPSIIMTQKHRPSPLFNLLITHAIIAHTSLLGANDMTLVEQGQPQAVLVVEADSEKSLRAAKAIQTYVQKMSGAELPMVLEGKEEIPADAPKGRIHVGHTSAAKDQNVPSGFDPKVRPDAFEEEGFVLRTLDDHTLLVAGNNDANYRGTIIGAYRLLEELGCRFYFPAEWGEVIPEKQTLVIPAMDLTEKPDFALRSIWLSGWLRTTKEESAAYEDWSHKIGLSHQRIYPITRDGSLGNLTPAKDYFETNPEFFAMGRDGERKQATQSFHQMLCLSNEGLFEESVRNIELAFKGEGPLARQARDIWPGSQGIGFSPPDGAPYCFCVDCKAASQNFLYLQYGNFKDRPTMSEEYYGFLSRIAEKFPDQWISTMAYTLREFPPQGVEIPDNLTVSVAPISADVIHPAGTKMWRRAQLMDLLRQWRELTPHVEVRDYNPGFLTGLFVPERDTPNIAINAPAYREIGVKGMRREGRKAFMQTWLSYYTTAKFLWNADTDLEALKADFYPTFFGEEAGPHVRAWWDACEQVLVESTTQAHEDFLVNHLYTKEFTDSIRRHVDAALGAGGTEAQKERVKAFALIAENLEQYAAMNEAISRMDWAAAAAAAERMVELKAEIHAIYPFFISPEHREQPRAFFAEGLAKRFRDLAALTQGEKGNLLAELPREMRFRRDPFNEGVIERWYRKDLDDSDWEKRDTFYLLEQQEEPLNERGNHYSGFVWYRTEFDLPADAKIETARLLMLGLINEGWIWVNGEYVGHRPWAAWWRLVLHPADFEIADKLRPGEKNTIAIRVLNDPDEMGGLYRRGFVYVPKPGAMEAESADEAEDEGGEDAG